MFRIEDVTVFVDATRDGYKLAVETRVYKALAWVGERLCKMGHVTFTVGLLGKLVDWSNRS